jgi:uncharacterized protein (DUF58 family)
MPRPRRRALGLIGGAAILFLVGTNVQAGWVLALAAVLLGAAVSGWILPARQVRGIEVERRAPSEATAGQAVAVDLVVRNPTRRPKLSLLVHDAFVAPATAFVPSLRPREHTRASTLREPARRGIVEGDPVVVSSSAPFGVATASRRVPAGGRTVIYPRVVPLGRVPLLDRPARTEPAPQTAPRHGSGGDFMGVREYRRGDSLRHVHWPSTAHHGMLIVREFEREEPRRLAILLDTWADSAPEDPESALDLACAVAASIGVHALARGAAVGLAAGRDGRVQALASAGRGELLAELAAARAPGGVTLEGLAEALDGMGSPDAALVVAPTWTANLERAPALAGALAERDIVTQVALIDAATFTPEREPVLDGEGAGRLSLALVSRGASVSRVVAGHDLAGALSAVPEAVR